MTPIFSRIWLMKTRQVFDLDTLAVSLRSAWLIRRACRPTCVSPISPSSSALGTRAAGEALAAKGDVQAQGAGGDAFDVELGVAAEPHDGALAELLLDLVEGGFEGLGAALVALGYGGG